uniref:Uncharacterized protein n=1 Tax=Streptomyces avermitilis TaxID=33903 RepID=A0A499VRT1_STRAX|nr:hypothetical protein SAVMC3_74770 [Streptomyces avermitilis]
MIQVHGHAGALGGVAVAAEGPQAADEVRPGGGSGSGFQRSRFGSGAVSVKGAVRIAPLSARVNGGARPRGGSGTATSAGCVPWAR